MNTFDNRRHPMTPSYLEYPTFDESAGFDPVPCAPQVIGRIEHHREGEPVRVALTAAGLSLPDGALLYAQPDHITDAGKKVSPNMPWEPVGIDSEGGSHD